MMRLMARKFHLDFFIGLRHPPAHPPTAQDDPAGAVAVGGGGDRKGGGEDDAAALRKEEFEGYNRRYTQWSYAKLLVVMQGFLSLAIELYTDR